MEDDTPAPLVVRNSRLADRYAEAVEAAERAKTAVRLIERQIYHAICRTHGPSALHAAKLIGEKFAVELSVALEPVVDWGTVAHRAFGTAWPKNEIHRAIHKGTRVVPHISFIVQPKEEDTNG